MLGFAFNALQNLNLDLTYHVDPVAKKVLHYSVDCDYSLTRPSLKSVAVNTFEAFKELIDQVCKRASLNPNVKIQMRELPVCLTLLYT